MKRIASWTLLALVLGCGWAQAATYTVDAGGGGDFTEIQAAIDAAIAGDVINVVAGTYREQLFINKDLTLTGAGAATTIIEAPDAVDRSTYGITTWTGSARTIDPVIGVLGANVAISGITVDGRDTGPAEFYGIHYHDSSGSVTFCTVTNITYGAAPGTQSVVSMSFGHSAVTGPFTLDISDNVVPTFQKGGIVVGGPEIVFTVERDTVSASPTAAIAGNGIQLSYGATGTTLNNVVTGIGYTGTDWAATGILLFESGDVTMTGDKVTDSQSGIGYSDWRWVYSNPDPVNLEFHDLVLTDNEWSLSAQLSGEESDLNLVMDGCEITGSLADALDIFGTGIDPWGGSYYTGWNNGDLDVMITDLKLDYTAFDGIWTGDFSGNATNTVHGFSVTGSSFTNTVGGAVANTFATTTIDATRNYWGDAAGPLVGAKATGSKSMAPLAAPAGFDLPKDGRTIEVAATAADKAAETVTGLVDFSPWYGLPLDSSPMIIGTNTSIGEAVGLAMNGDTINVAAGNYAEYVTITKSLTFTGANAGIHPAVGTHPTETVGVRGPESIIDGGNLDINAPNIVLDGFTFALPSGRLLDSYESCDGFQLLNNIIYSAGGQRLLQFDTSGGIEKSRDDMRVAFNHWMVDGTNGAMFLGGGNIDDYDRLTVEYNYINCEEEFIFWAADVLVDGVFRGNEIDGNRGGVPGQTIGITNIGKAGNLKILDNWAHDTWYTPFQVGLTNGQVSGNTFEGLYPYAGAYSACVQLWGGQYGTTVSSNVSITDNVFIYNNVPGITDPAYAVHLRGPANPGDPAIDGTTIMLRDNQFIDGGVVPSSIAVRHQGDPALWVDAIGNDWGDISGPYHATLNPLGTGVPVGDFVTFEPWTGQAGLGIVPVTSGTLACNQPLSMTFQYTADDVTPDMFLYNITVAVPPQLTFNTVTDEEPFGAANNNFFITYNGNGTWTFTGSTVGDPSSTSPVVGPGTFDLFTIHFMTANDGIGAVTFADYVFRDPTNASIPAVAGEATVSVDCTPPAAVTNITATPGNNKINVTWSHDGIGVDHYEVFVAMWGNGSGASAYPEYDDLPSDVIPGRPADYLIAVALPAWVGLPAVPAPNLTLTQTWPNHLSRGIYYYEVFAVDDVGNGSPRAAANDRSTNYWLGDVYGVNLPGQEYVPNGLVNVGDVNYMSGSFGNTLPTGSPLAVHDVGPTDDWSRLGIPLTDSVINFEDLMVFSMNFGVVSAAKDAVPFSDRIALAWVDYGDGRYGLRLVDGNGLKGLRITANAEVTLVETGTLLDEQGEPTFLRNLGGGLDASVAVMGVNNGFAGSGDLMIVNAKQAIDLNALTITARGLDNSTLEVSLELASGTLAPRVFALHPNYPNPFNPMTKISFSLPEAQPVTLAIYAVDGRRVATLINETRSAGLHEAIWNGQDDGGRQSASGVYFCRIDAGPYSQVRKMTLMK